MVTLRYEAVDYDGMKVLNNLPYVVLSFDLWMSVKMIICFNIRPSLRGTKNGYLYLVMTITKVTDENNPSESIIGIITKFNLGRGGVVGFTCDDGVHMKKLSDNICSELYHTAVFILKKPIFSMK